MSKKPNTKVLQHLTETDWGPLIKKMIAYGTYLSKTRYNWLSNTTLPQGNDIKDIVYTVIKKLYAGERNWDPDRVSLTTWLKNNIRSEMSNLFNSSLTAEHKPREISLSADPEDNNSLADSIEYQAAKNNISSYPKNPEDIILEQEQFDATIKALYEAIENDPLLEEIYFLLLSGCERKPKAIAEKLRRPVSDINNALKRLNRRSPKQAKKESYHDAQKSTITKRQGNS